jgi:phosphoglucomutase
MPDTFGNIINVTQSKKLFHSGDTFFEILNMRFHSGINAICSKENIEHLVESHDRVTRYVETLNDIRDRAQIINEEIDKLNSAKLNSMT